MPFKTDERIYETSVTTGAGDYTLAGAQAGFQAVSVIGANNYGPFFITDDVNWEAVIGTYIAAPARLQRTAVKASSNGGAAVNWGAGTKKIRCGWPAWLATPQSISKSVAGGVDVTLTADEQRRRILILTGALTASINVIVDATVWDWIIYNNTSGAFKLTVKTAAGTGIAVPQGGQGSLYCDGTNVVRSVMQDVKTTVASAASPDIWTGTGELIDYTGAVNTTGFAAAPQAGASRQLLCAGAPLFTHAAATFVVAGNANYQAAAGDRILVVAETTTKFRLYPLKADGTAVASAGTVPRSYLAGCTLSTAGASITMNVAAGQAVDDANGTAMALAAIAKTTAAWAVGTAAGGLDTGVIANNTWYHFFVIQRTDTNVVDVLISLSATAPTMPANYTLKRRIGAGKTNGVGQWQVIPQDGDYFVWSVPPALDVDVINPGTLAITRTLSVPTGINVFALFHTVIAGGSTNSHMLYSDLAIADTAPSITATPLFSQAQGGVAGNVPWGGLHGPIRTNTSAQIRSRLVNSDAGTTVKIVAVGWIDRRGRNA